MSFESYAYRMRKVTDQELERTIKFLNKNGRFPVNSKITYFTEEIFEWDAYLIADIMGLLTRVLLTQIPGFVPDDVGDEGHQTGSIFLVYEEQVCYWLNAKDLHNQVSFACEKSIENCGFYWCNEDMLEAMIEYNKKSGKGCDFTKDDEDIYYHVWW